MRNLLKVLTSSVALVVVACSIAVAGSRGVDARIRIRIAHFLSDHGEYSHIQFDVDDTIVTLQGTVELESQREALIRQVKALPEVAAIKANIVLYPPAPADDVLYPRVLHRLESLHISKLQISVHEGLVTIAGSVRNEHDQQRILAIAQGTDGVKEIVSQLRIEEGR